MRIETDWVENASMEFDTDSLLTDLSLYAGVPGRSNVLLKSLAA